jgi:iron complex outermembrane receptor protein
MNFLPSHLRHTCLFILFFLLFQGFALAGSIHGVVQSNDLRIVGATVRILELDRMMHTDSNGEFTFPQVPSGTYHIFVRSLGYASTTSVIQVRDGTAEVSFSLKASAIPGEDVVVSASPYARMESDQYQPVATKDAVELHQSSGSTFSEEIDDIPGVAARYNAAAPTRPILRGLGNNEVLVLENGLHMGDLATFDPAHATPIEMDEVQEVDIVRGPAAIFYGPNTIGGLVNVITNTIPMASSKTVSGNASVTGNSVNDQYSGHFNTVWSDGSSALGISAGGMHSDNISIPSATYTDPGTSQTFQLDTMPQSFIHTTEEGIGYSYQSDFGMIGVGVKHYYSNYGITGDPVDLTQQAPGPTTSRITQEKYTVELKGLFEVGGSFINQIKLNANTTDYMHSEFPTILQSDSTVTDSVQNSFHLNGYNATVQFIEQRMGNWQGTLGIWSDIENVSMGGPQPLGPNSLTTGLAGYAFEEYLASENTRIQGAIRFDRNNISTFASPNSPIPAFVNFNETRTSNALTGSFGIIQKLTSEITGSINIGRSFRAPTMQELFSTGPDDASQSSMIGDSNLVPETSTGIDLLLTGRFSNFTFSFSPYINFIHDYIYSYNTGIQDTINQPSYAYRKFAQDSSARVYGYEVSATAQLMEHLALTVSSDYVNAQDVSRDTALPTTPPLRGILRLNYLDNTYSGMIEWRLVSAQNRLGDGDFYTAGYGVVNLGFGVRLFSGEIAHNISIHCDNLLNKLYYNNLSAIGSFLPQPARGFRVAYNVTF